MTEDDRSAPVAALDCGTNSTRLLIAEGEGMTITRQMVITRLGAGVDATQQLAGDAMDRTISALTGMKAEMDRAGVRRARLVATSAVRDAKNGGVFLEAATRTTGVRAELLSGDEEGRLSYAGATADLVVNPGADVVVDIGGGSTELVVGYRGDLRAISLDLGCVRLTERHLHHDPPTATELDDTVVTINRQLDRAVSAIPLLDDLPEPRRLLGLAGTVSTVAMLEQELADYERDRVHGFVLSEAAVSRWCTELASEPSSARAVRPGMAKGREDVIVGGVLVLREVMTRLQVASCTVSESDILDGLVASLLS